MRTRLNSAYLLRVLSKAQFPGAVSHSRGWAFGFQVYLSLGGRADFSNRHSRYNAYTHKNIFTLIPFKMRRK
jgi:hypothetical protein